ncbi:MAG: LLM class F420-dependent oxidoreductase [Kineosporiaceae bacterium]
MDLRIFTEPQLGASYDQQLRLARAAEDAGFDGFFRSDHYLTMGSHDGLPGPTDAWITLAGLARETSRLRLGTLVSSATFRQPGVLAITVAQVDQMSGGRIELGLGAGWFEAEHAAYGIPFPPLGERFDRLEEQLAVITGLWATPPGQTFEHSGPLYPITGSPGLPKPAQSPRPPIIIGGAGRKRTAALAARYADEFNVPFAPPERAAEIVTAIRTACEDAGRDPSSLVFSIAGGTAVGRSDADVARRVAFMGNTVEALKADGFAGSPDEIVARVGEYAELGISRVYFQLQDHDDLDALELLASDVAPQLR